MVHSGMGSIVCHHLMICKFSSSIEGISVLCYENKMYLLELNKSLFIMPERSKNQNICSTRLHLFEWLLSTLFAALCGLLWSVLVIYSVVRDIVRHLMRKLNITPERTGHNA